MMLLLHWILFLVAPSRDVQPAVSPSGERLAWVSNRSGSWQVWMDDGNGARQMTTDSLAVGWPSFSADGRHIYFYSGQQTAFAVWRMPVEGGVRQRVTHGVDFRASESPDGRQLLFDRSVDGNHDLHIMDMESGQTVAVAPHPGYDSDGRWSPDGRRILFHSDRTGSMQVFDVETESGRVRQLSHGPELHLYPSWCPDGRRIAWVAETAHGQRRIEGFDLATGRTVPLTGPDTESPVWSPDGKILYFSERLDDDTSRISRLESSFCTP